MNRSVLASVALAASGALLFSACSSGSSSVSGQQMVGTWAGTNSGYVVNDAFVTQETKLVVERAEGQAFAGYKEWTEADGTTASQEIKGVVTPEGRVFIVEEDAVLEATLSGSEITGVYAETGEDHAAFAVALTKQ